VPALPGIERFTGTAFHSAQWNHDYDLRGKKVAVVGTGASAIQFVPRIAQDVQRLSLFQRTPPWVMPKPDHPMPSWTHTLFKWLPGAQRAYRNALYWLLEVRAIGFNSNQWILRLAERMAAANLRRVIKDPDLRRKLTPDYRMGCKRVLLSNDYYPALTRDNVDVVTDGIAEVLPGGIRTADGTVHDVDAIIYGTGFHVTDSYDTLDITGRDGKDLAKHWQEHGLTTHYGITVAGFPNLFFLLGPNTALGHNSVVFMIESQVRYVLDAIKLLDRTGTRALDVRAAAQESFQQDMQRKLVKGIWSTGGCRSWYLDAKGVNRTIWPGFTWRYWLDTRRVEPGDYELIGARSPAGGAARGGQVRLG
jgi:cation diffusion facilitator CzcD-associated flavoprotein CzcO